MTTIEEIEKAVAELTPDQLAPFRVWFEEFEANRFDQKIERDAQAGRLDRLADQALADFRADRARKLWGTSPVPHSGKRMTNFRMRSEPSPTRIIHVERESVVPVVTLKKVGRFWSVRIGSRYRALAVDVDGGLLWFWIGSHADYDAII